MPPSRAFGKTLLGSLVSSTTLAAFSKPVIAKNAIAAPVSASSAGFLSPLNSNGLRQVGVAVRRGS